MTQIRGRVFGAFVAADEHHIAVGQLDQLALTRVHADSAAKLPRRSVVVAVEAVREAAQPALADVLAVTRRHDEPTSFRAGAELNHRVARPDAVALMPIPRPHGSVALAGRTGSPGPRGNDFLPFGLGDLLSLRQSL